MTSITEVFCIALFLFHFFGFCKSENQANMCVNTWRCLCARAFMHASVHACTCVYVPTEKMEKMQKIDGRMSHNDV